MSTIHFSAPLTPFVGRTEELQHITNLLHDPNCRLLTLVGAGGIGKTRLALEIATQQADSYAHGVHFVALQPLNSAEFILSAIIDALSLQFYFGSEPKRHLLDYLRDKSLLIILDNFEHLLEGVGLISEILSATRHVKILTTSRETLNLQEEWLYPVRGMPFPENSQSSELETYSAVQLFTQSARRARPDFSLDNEQAAVLRICKLVEGMPLALEMAAAWLKRLSCAEIATEIERGLDILQTPARNVELRHQSMRAVFEHSWDLLADSERAVFKKLSVFRGGFRKEAAQSIAGASLWDLSSLVDKSLLQVNVSGRYDLHELLRQYAAEKLDTRPEEAVQTCDAHCAYFAELMRQSYEASYGTNVKEALDAMERDIENIQAGCAWAAQGAKRDELWKFGPALVILGVDRSRYLDVQNALVHGVTGLDTNQPGWEQDELLGCILAYYTYFSPDFSSEDYNLYQKSCTILMNIPPEKARRETSLALNKLGQHLYARNPVERKQLWEQAEKIDRLRSNSPELMLSIGNLAIFCFLNEEDTVRGKALCDEGLALARELRSKRYIAVFNWILCEAFYTNPDQDLETTKRLAREAAAIFQEIGEHLAAGLMLNIFGDFALIEANYTEARKQYYQVFIRMRELSFTFYNRPLISMADLFMREGNTLQAIEMLAFVLSQDGWLNPDHRPRARQLLAELEAELPNEVFQAAVRRGETHNLDAVFNELFSNLEQRIGIGASMSHVKHSSLNQRELEILGLIADGLSNREIAQKLFLTEGTVKWYNTQIYGKIGVQNRAQAVKRAQELNLLT